MNLCNNNLIMKKEEFKIRKKKYLDILIFFLSMLFIIYIYKAYGVFSEIYYFITPGASYIIKMLEFASFREHELFILFISYFILISSYISILFLIKQFNNKKNKLKLYCTLYMVLSLCILGYVSNIFWLIYFVLTCVSLLVIYSAVLISKFIWGKTIQYNPNEVIYESKYFESKNEASNEMTKKIKEIKMLIAKNGSNSNIAGSLIEYNSQFCFKIFSKDIVEIHDSVKEKILDDKKSK